VIIQNYFQEVRKSLDNIILLENEAKEARNTFQKEVACTRNREMEKNLKLSVKVQIRGDIVLKVWETNISENKKIVKEIKDDYEGIFDSLDKKALGIERNDFFEPLGYKHCQTIIELQRGIEGDSIGDFTIEGNRCQPNRWMAGTTQFKVASDRVCR
jgi:hypothetical protein